jgi:type VI secretion system protein ImpF
VNTTPQLLREPVQLSVLDRLLDDAPGETREATPSRSAALAALRAAVRRDLEALLNSRLRPRSTPKDLTEVDTSVVGFGIPDFVAVSAEGGEWRERLRRALEERIRRYEPRFIRVSVALMQEGEGLERSIRFRIEALMRADPAPEQLSFDSRIEPAVRLLSVVDRS